MTPQDERRAVTRVEDVCECGDYRRFHIGGTGRCTMPDDLCHGFTPCTEFRLSSHHINKESGNGE